MSRLHSKILHCEFIAFSNTEEVIIHLVQMLVEKLTINLRTLLLLFICWFCREFTRTLAAFSKFFSVWLLLNLSKEFFSYQRIVWKWSFGLLQVDAYITAPRRNSIIFRVPQTSVKFLKDSTYANLWNDYTLPSIPVNIAFKHHKLEKKQDTRVYRLCDYMFLLFDIYYRTIAIISRPTHSCCVIRSAIIPAIIFQVTNHRSSSNFWPPARHVGPFLSRD